MGELECKSINTLETLKARDTDAHAAGHISLHAVRGTTQEDGDAYIEGQIFKHGLVVKRASGSKQVRPMDLTYLTLSRT